MVFQSDLLKGKVALITGGGTGICRGIALALASHGCDVAITSRKREHLEPTAAEIERHGRRSVAVVADVRDPAAVDTAVAETVDELGRLDILVNGAAGNFLCRAEDLSPNGFGAVVDIDLKGTFHMSKAALPHLASSRLLKNTRIGLFSWPSCVSRPPRQRCARGHAVPTRGPATPAAGDQGHLASRFRNRTKL